MNLSKQFFSVIFAFSFLLNANEVYISRPFLVSEKLELSSINPERVHTLNNQRFTFWFRDSTQQLLKEQHFFSFSNLLAIGQTPFHSYAIVEADIYGKILFIDGEVHSAEADEQIYHESLVHPAMVAHLDPQKILVIGTASGATVREILRHPMVESLVVVDFDEEIRQQCEKHLPNIHEELFNHPKVQLVIDEGKKYVVETDEKFDVIVIDVYDRLDNNRAAEFHSEEFYNSLKKILNPQGIITVQAMEFDHKVNKDHLLVHKNLKKVFSTVSSYNIYVPSFLATWGFVMAHDDSSLILSAEEIDEVLIDRGLNHQLKHYDGITHQHMFSIPKGLRMF